MKRSLVAFVCCAALCFGQAPKPGFVVGYGSGTQSTVAYGELIITGNSSSVTLTNQNQYYVIATNWVAQDISRTTMNAGAGTITTNLTGEFMTAASLTTSVGAANHTYEFAVFLNGSAIPGHTASRTSNSNTLFTITVIGLKGLTSGDVIDLRARCTDAAGQSVTVTDANFNIFAVGV